MLGLLLTLLVALGWTGVGWEVVKRLKVTLDSALTIGISGLTGLGVLGLLTFFIGLVPGGFGFGLYLVGLVSVGGLALFYKTYKSDMSDRTYKVSLPDGPWKLIPLVLLVASLLAVVSVLAPVNADEWDALAYHLAVPKQWIAAGQITWIPTIHHSNFPFVVDNLYIWGLQWGGESGARAFQLAFYAFGLLSIFGFTRQRYGAPAAWWATLAFGTVPAILWEAGSAYIDLAHGLYAGLGILFAMLLLEPSDEEQSNRGYLWIAALMLGFGAASKYTGLQTLFAVALILVIGSVKTKQLRKGFSAAVLMGVVAVVMASPWLVRNGVNVGNPVYPFFYSVFKGKNWDAENTAIYTNEQKSFGVGAHAGQPIDLTATGQALLGLALQPARYTNPRPDLGLGSPLGSVGFVGIVALLAWMVSGRMRRFEGGVVAVVLISAAIWFALSQQSRYIITWMVPLAVLAGAATSRLKFGQVVAAAIALQAIATLFLMNTLRTSAQLQVVLGSVSADDYRSKTIPFTEAARDINTRVKDGKVALYDEVFGSLLDVPYVWANPGHSTLFKGIPMTEDGSAYVQRMKENGVKYIYINLSPSVKDRELAKLWIASMGLNGAPSSQEWESRVNGSWETDWMVQLSRAVRSHLVAPISSYRNGILFQIK